MRKAILALAALSVVGACGGPTDPPPNEVVTVTVTTPSPSIVVGATAQLTATAIKKDGSSLANPSVTWQSNAPNVATVSNTGLVTGVAVGTAVIQATVQGKVGLATITVTGDPCAAPISLTVGEVRTFAGPDQVRCVKLAATTTPSEFLVVAYNGADVQDERRNVEVAGSVSPSAQVATQVSTLSEALQVLELERIAATDAMHERIDAISRKLVEPVIRLPRAPTTPRLSHNVAANVATLAPLVGDTLTYRVPNLNQGKSACLDFFPISAVVRAVGTRALIVQDVAAPAGGFTTTDYNDIVREFDTLIFATDTMWFGSPSDRNNDGLITILYTPEVNKLTPAGSAGFTAGFFFRADLFTKAEFQQAGQQCPTTNEHELFYVLTPDPSGTINNNVRSTATVRQTTRGTIAHELEHMINQGVRMFIPGAQLEHVWLDEAMAHFAEEAVGRASRGFTDFRELTFPDVSADVNDYNAYFRQNLGRFRLWMFRPDTASPTSNRAATELAPRGAGWSVVRYAIDRHSNNNGRAFTRALVRGPQTNISNLMARVGSGLGFSQFIGNWMVTNFADHQNIAGLPATFNYVGWNMRSTMTQFNNNSFPLAVNTLQGSLATLVISGSGAYFRLSKGAGGGTSTVAMQAPGGIPVDFSGARLTLVRTQ